MNKNCYNLIEINIKNIPNKLYKCNILRSNL